MLNEASSLLEGHRGSGLPLLRVFYLTIQVTHLLMAGQVSCLVYCSCPEMS